MPTSDHAKGVPIEERLLRKLELAGSCWRWSGFTTDQGYGMIYWNGRRWFVHRVSYLVFVGPIPEGLTLDHLCHSDTTATCRGGPTCLHRRCFNPEHLEPCTVTVNTKRGFKATTPTCQHGHPMDGRRPRRWDSDRWQRFCTTCERERKRPA